MSNILQKKTNRKDSTNFQHWKLTLKIRILQSLRRSLIILVGLTITWYTEKMMDSTVCYCGFRPNSHKNSWRVSYLHGNQNLLYILVDKTLQNTDGWTSWQCHRWWKPCHTYLFWNRFSSNDHPDNKHLFYNPGKAINIDLKAYGNFRRCAIITRSWLESALDYKLRILGPTIEEFPLLNST